MTGHIRLTRGSARPIYRELRITLAELAGDGDLHGVTCLAEGADSLFAKAVRSLRGSFDVILTGPPGHRTTRRLLRSARHVRRVRPDARPELRYAAASAEVLDSCDILVAVWDGSEDGTYGGTAHTVALARDQGKTVHVVWPPKARRRGYVGGGSMSHSRRAPAAAA
ncbi:hypothetical protein [Symbioplanes lichenis]|uniref:hypothetical protein n=1 Tax=Symbioplanes lichenis TaxID=1629072 RepID=UPI00273A0C3C|nr:hypothetical protein [Actinoplanes lichenis]